MKTLKKYAVVSAVMVAVLALVAAFAPIAPEALAACDPNQGISGGIDCTDTGNTPADAESIFTTIVNILLFIIGAISVIMLIIGGIRYTVSGGDSGNVTAAKNTILYAIIGLVVAFLAFAIVNWVLDALS